MENTSEYHALSPIIFGIPDILYKHTHIHTSHRHLCVRQYNKQKINNKHLPFYFQHKGLFRPEQTLVSFYHILRATLSNLKIIYL